jgi:hypothetical protein
MLPMSGRCEICGGSFELPLVFDPVTLRTDFDLRPMIAHQAAAAHQAADRQHKRQ